MSSHRRSVARRCPDGPQIRIKQSVTIVAERSDEEEAQETTVHRTFCRAFSVRLASFMCAFFDLYEAPWL